MQAPLDGGRCRPRIGCLPARAGWLLLATSLLLLPGPVVAQDVTVDELYDVQALLSLAESGEPRAAFLLGSRYAAGRGGVRDDSQAVRWFRLAAERGLAEAQYNLGVMYADGRGVEQDMGQAARWYRQAAEQGIAQAQYNLGTLYGLGLGVPQDEAVGAAWFHRAADLELPEAQYNLGVLYEHGRGVRLDGRAALMWYERAARQGLELAEARLGALREKLQVDAPEVATNSGAIVTALPDSTSVAIGASIAAADTAGLPSVALPEMEASQGLPEIGLGWLERVDPTRYTLQVASDTDESSIRRLVHDIVSSERSDYFASKRDGTVWYSAVVGLFDTHESANAAIASLPESMRRAGPWVRKVGTIQAVMLRDGTQ